MQEITPIHVYPSMDGDNEQENGLDVTNDPDQSGQALLQSKSVHVLQPSAQK